MTEQLQMLKELHINTRSHIRAVNDVRKLEYTPDQYRDLVTKLTGTQVQMIDTCALHVAQYVVQHIVKNVEIDLNDIIHKATAYVTDNPWITAEQPINSYYVPKATVDAVGNPKEKKGTKKIKAVAFWKENQDKFKTRGEWVTALMNAVGLTKAGASTYYHNLKTGLYC